MKGESTHTGLAAVFTGPGEPISLEPLALPRLAGGEVLVRVKCCTLCGSDLHTWRGERKVPVPTILGHEIIGVIEAFGEGPRASTHDGKPLEVGDRVTWSIAASCGGCFFCGHDLPQKCESLFKYGHEKLDDAHQFSGGLAEYCHLAAGTAMVRVPEALSDRVACPANCATATVAAALRTGSAGGGPASAVVHGAGMLGLTACAMLRSGGAEVVIAADLDRSRLELAREFGATHTVEVSSGGGSLEQVVGEATGGRGVDLALEMSGAAAAVEAGLESLRIGGRQVLVGAVFPTAPVSIQPEAIVRNLKSIHGVHNYTPGDLVAAIDFLGRHQGDFPFESLVQGGFALRDADAAFEEAIRSRVPRVLVRVGA